jgi:hypothetical protein
MNIQTDSLHRLCLRRDEDRRSDRSILLFAADFRDNRLYRILVQRSHQLSPSSQGYITMQMAAPGDRHHFHTLGEGFVSGFFFGSIRQRISRFVIGLRLVVAHGNRVEAIVVVVVCQYRGWPGYVDGRSRRRVRGGRWDSHGFILIDGSMLVFQISFSYVAVDLSGAFRGDVEGAT